MSAQEMTYRYFVSYSGVKLPLKLVNEITLENMHNRNTYYRGTYDEKGHLRRCEKIVYGEVDVEHQYRYDDLGNLVWAKITEGDEAREIYYTPQAS